MNEEPKSIWKKSWKGPRGLLLWFIALAAAAFVVVFFIGWVSALENRMGKLAVFASLFAITFALVGVLIGAFIHWLFCWRNFKRFLFGVACLITLIALAYAEEGWRGWHAWNQFKHEWEAKGEKFDWQSVIPPPVPDDQNFAMSPVWIAEEKYVFQNTPKRAEAWYGDRIYSEEVSKILPLLPVSVSALVGTNWAYRLPPMPETSGNWATAHLPDLKPWQAYYRGLEETNPAANIPIAPQPQSPAADALLALSKFDPVIEQLRQDSARPFSRFPIGYDDEDKAMILLPHLAAVKRYSQVLQLHAIAELQNGQPEKTLDDVNLMLRLTDAVRTEPVLISHLVRIAMLQITLQPIYEGLAEHKWSDTQLAELDSELGKLDFLADFEFSTRGELGFATSEFSYLRRSRNFGFFGFSGIGNDQGTKAVYRFCPGGWFYQNNIRYCRFILLNYLPTTDVSRRLVFPATASRANDAIEKGIAHPNPYNWLENIFLSSFKHMLFEDYLGVKDCARAQSTADLARTAIALERYRLAHSEYPESLDALAPQFMEKVPHDIIGGQPLHYRRTDDGQFVLYSVGWNERDDGGVVVLNGPFGKSGSVNFDQGDWVWRYPKKE